MKLRTGHIAVAALVLLLLLPGCGRRGRIIPTRKLADIYVDMFLADQWISDNHSSRRVADTSDFYGPIFKAHGYSFRDYDLSVNHYLGNPDNFSRLLDRSAEILEKRIKGLKDEEARREKVAELERYLRENLLPHMDFEKDDTLLWRPDTLSVLSDSLAALPDSLAVQSDSLDAPLITPVPRAITIDSFKNVKGRNRIRTDSLTKARIFARD